MSSYSFKTSIVINKPAQTIYTYVADLPRHVEWNNQPQEMIPLQNGVIEVGSKFQTKEGTPRNAPFMQKMMFAIMTPIMKLRYGMSSYTFAEITVLETNNRVAWKAHLPAKKFDMMRANWEVQLEPQGDSTKVTQFGEFTPPDESPFANFLNEDSIQDIKAETHANLELLKSILEGQP